MMLALNSLHASSSWDWVLDFLIEISSNCQMNIICLGGRNLKNTLSNRFVCKILNVHSAVHIITYFVDRPLLIVQSAYSKMISFYTYSVMLV
jgi:hypothetical protein